MLLGVGHTFIVKTRLIHTLLFVLSGNAAMGQRADSVVTINEIHYHPALTGEPEWLELHNQMVVRVDVSGWKLTEGIDFTFPEGSVMEPGGYWVLSSDPSHASMAGEAPTVMPPQAGRSKSITCVSLKEVPLFQNLPVPCSRFWVGSCFSPVAGDRS